MRRERFVLGEVRVIAEAVPAQAVEPPEPGVVCQAEPLRVPITVPIPEAQSEIGARNLKPALIRRPFLYRVEADIEITDVIVKGGIGGGAGPDVVLKGHGHLRAVQAPAPGVRLLCQKPDCRIEATGTAEHQPLQHVLAAGGHGAVRRGECDPAPIIGRRLQHAVAAALKVIKPQGQRQAFRSRQLALRLKHPVPRADHDAVFDHTVHIGRVPGVRGNVRKPCVLRGEGDGSERQQQRQRQKQRQHCFHRRFLLLQKSARRAIPAVRSFRCLIPASARCSASARRRWTC